MGHVLPLEFAKQQVSRVKPDLVVVVLAPNPDAALTIPAELRGLVQGRILAVGPAADTRLVLRALRSGADDYVDEADLDYELDAALTRMRDANTAKTEPGRLIVMLAPSGGSGSSTLAVNVAAALAKEHNGVGLVDLKLEAGDLAALLDLRPNHTLADFCQNSKQMDRAIFERCLVKHEETGVQLLAAPRHFADVGHVTAGGVRQALTMARRCSPTWSSTWSTRSARRTPRCSGRPTSCCWSCGWTSPRCGTRGGCSTNWSRSTSPATG